MLNDVQCFIMLNIKKIVKMKLGYHKNGAADGKQPKENPK